ncbi:hypothetical protein [Kutzneria kofuensis]
MSPLQHRRLAGSTRRSPATSTVDRDTGDYQTAQRAWHACATKAGYDHARRVDLIDAFQKRLDAIKQRLSHSTQDPKALQDLLAHDPQFVQLRADEVAAATAALPCSLAADAVYSKLFDTALAAAKQ